jgi:quinoprotein glucose dehydrogenase
MKSANGVPGPSLLIAAALLGVAVSVVNYVTPDNGIAGTPGALLVIVSTVALALVAWMLRRRFALGRGRGVLWQAIALFLLAGTAFAAWLLEAPVLVALMMVFIVIQGRRDA